MIFATGFPFSVLVAKLMVTFLSLLRVFLLLLMSIFVLKLSNFFRVREFALYMAIGILEGPLKPSVKTVWTSYESKKSQL